MKPGPQADPLRPVIIEGPVNQSRKVRFTKLLRADGSTFSITAKRYVRNGEDSIVIEEIDPPSAARRIVFFARTTEREWLDALDQLEETA